jgi:hypothetical protein
MITIQALAVLMIRMILLAMARMGTTTMLADHGDAEYDDVVDYGQTRINIASQPSAHAHTLTLIHGTNLR